MSGLESLPAKWVSKVLDVPFTASKHIHSHQDEVYKIGTSLGNYYLKMSKSLKNEHDNLKRLEAHLNVPQVIGFQGTDENDYLLISELSGKNLAELTKEWSGLDIVDTFAEAIRHLHSLDTTKIFAEASSKDVLLHGDMALPNIIRSEQGRIGYIDFGQMSFGSPELDLVDAIWSLQRNIGPGYGELFLNRYGAVTIIPMIEAALNFRYQPTENE